MKMRFETGSLNASAWLIGLAALIAVLCPVTSVRAESTNLNYTVDEINTAIRHGLIMTNEAYSAGQADIGFGDVVITTNMTAATWTNVNISEYVGTNSAIVMLLIEDLSGAANDVIFRRWGDNTDFNNQDGVTAVQLDANDKAYVWAPTTSSGALDVDSDGAFSIKMIVWIRKHVWE